MIRQWQQRAIDTQTLELSFAVRFGAVTGAIVEIKTYECETDAEGLNRRGIVAEPDDGDNDDKNTLDKRGDRVGDWRDERKKNKGKDVLSEVEDAVEKELEG